MSLIGEQLSHGRPWQHGSPQLFDTARYQSRDMRLVEKGFDFCFKMSV
jgi:hypothetical protein